jgi:hypothetical protein
MNLNLNDPSLPAPGELAMSASSRSRSGQWPHSPHHERNPSLGELHQELEYEQEGQVVCLLTQGWDARCVELVRHGAGVS